MRVALLYPEVYDMARFRERRREFPPFGALYLAAVLEDTGHEVTVIQVRPDQLALDLTGHDAVGFSLASSATTGFMAAARTHSQIDPGTFVMVGGVHANFYPDEALRDFDADVVCEGESEETILEVLDRAATGRPVRGIAGTRWLKDGKVHRGAVRVLMRDIDRLPLPARHLLPVEDVVMTDRLAGRDVHMAHVMFSRGCPFPCTFCAAGQTRIQYRSGASARTELTHLIDRYHVGGFAIVDDNFVVNKRKVADICDAVADLDLTWSALSRVDTVDAGLRAFDHPAVGKRSVAVVGILSVGQHRQTRPRRGRPARAGRPGPA